MNTTHSMHLAEFYVSRAERDQARSAGLPGLMACAHCGLLHVDPAIARDCSMTATPRGWVCSELNGCAFDRADELLTWLEAA